MDKHDGTTCGILESMGVKPPKGRKRKITVWDYFDAAHGSYNRRELEKPVKYEVDAWCVQGETGFIAYFIIDDRLYEAHGDDGHWWLVGVINTHWLKEWQETVAALSIKGD